MQKYSDEFNLSQSQVFSLLSEFKGLLLARQKTISATQAIIKAYEKDHDRRKTKPDTNQEPE